MACGPCSYGRHPECQSEDTTMGDCCCAPPEEALTCAAGDGVHSTEEDQERCLDCSRQLQYDHDEHFGRKP